MAVCKHFMTDILNKSIVLVLNRNWQAINIRTPQEAFCQMATNVATALEIELGDGARAEALRPVTWDEWITLPIRDGDNAVRTVRGAIRVPTVIVAVNFAKVPKKRPKLCARTIRERDGNRCQYRQCKWNRSPTTKSSTEGRNTSHSVRSSQVDSPMILNEHQRFSPARRAAG